MIETELSRFSLREGGRVPTSAGTRTLKQKIAAIRIGEQPEPRSGGVFTQLPPGSQIEMCGAGFNEKTIMVRCQSELYVVFRHDVDDRC